MIIRNNQMSIFQVCVTHMFKLKKIEFRKWDEFLENDINVARIERIYEQWYKCARNLVLDEYVATSTPGVCQMIFYFDFD